MIATDLSSVTNIFLNYLTVSPDDESKQPDFLYRALVLIHKIINDNSISDASVKRRAAFLCSAIMNSIADDLGISASQIDLDKYTTYHNLCEFAKSQRMLSALTEARRESIAALLATVPENAEYENLAAQLGQLSHEFRNQFATRLGPALNSRIQGMPHGTLDEKKELARWVNAELERFGLAVKCPKTGLPAKLRGITGNWPGIGRFAIEIYVDGKQKTTSTSDTLPNLELIDVNFAISPEGPPQPGLSTKRPRSDRTRG